MIISFTLENWMSFRDPVAFSMVASRERQHGDRIPKLDNYKRMRVLPIATIYGGNASGKTNFFRALNFVQRFVVRGTSPDARIPVEPFKLDEEMAKQPSKFQFELFAENKIYEFSFSVTDKSVVEEKLILISLSDEKTLYHRKNSQITFHDSLENEQFLQFAFHGTRENQLFLTNSVSQRVDNFRPVYNWFKDTLELIAPDARFGAFEQFFDEDHPLFSAMNKILPKLDTGIAHLGQEVMPLDKIQLPPEIKDDLQENVKENTIAHLVNANNFGRILINRKDGELISKKLLTYHTQSNGREVPFEIEQESDGTKRVIELLPAFLELSEKSSTKVYIIDEIDRSLHSLLTRKIIEGYLAHCSAQSRTQLLLSTHDILLMDQHLLRRDEMWITERDAAGASNLYSFNDYEGIRYDKDIRKSYLQGRFGGIPRFIIGDALITEADGVST